MKIIRIINVLTCIMAFAASTVLFYLSLIFDNKVLLDYATYLAIMAIFQLMIVVAMR